MCIRDSRKVEYIEDIPAKSLVGIKLTNPITGDIIISLPASFVRPENGSGIAVSYTHLDVYKRQEYDLCLLTMYFLSFRYVIYRKN